MPLPIWFSIQIAKKQWLSELEARKAENSTLKNRIAELEADVESRDKAIDGKDQDLQDLIGQQQQREEEMALQQFEQLKLERGKQRELMESSKELEGKLAE